MFKIRILLTIAITLATWSMAARITAAQAVSPQPPAVKFPSNVAKMVARSDKFWADAKNGNIPQDELKTEAKKELKLLAAIKAGLGRNATATPQQKADIARRVKDAEIIASDQIARMLTEVELMQKERLLSLRKGTPAEDKEQLSAIKLHRADNLLHMGTQNLGQPFVLLREALKLAQECSYAKQLPEADIHLTLAAAYTRAKNWPEVLKHSNDAIEIITPFSTKPKFDKKGWWLANWYASLSKAAQGADATQELKGFITLVDEGTTPSKEAEVYVQILELGPMLGLEDSPMLIPIRERYAAVLTGMKQTKKAQAQLDEVKRLQDLAVEPKQ